MKKIIGLYPDSENKPRIKVSELIKALEQLPQEQEIVIYPKYDEVDGYHKHRFRIENVMRQEQNDGYHYCAILF